MRINASGQETSKMAWPVEIIRSVAHYIEESQPQSHTEREGICEAHISHSLPLACRVGVIPGMGPTDGSIRFAARSRAARRQFSPLFRLSHSGLIVAAALLAMPYAVDFATHGAVSLISKAHAQDEGSEGHKGGKDVKGGHGEDKGKGGEKGQKDSLTKGPSSSRGDYEASGQGPRQKSGSSGTRGTKPVWASEGVTIELGRLNVARAPQSVRDRQLAEALKNAATTPALMGVYGESIEQFAATLTKDTVRADAPLANLSMYQAFIKELAKNPSATSVTIRSVDKETKQPLSYTFNLTGGATPTSVLGIMLGSAADKDQTKIGGLNAGVVDSINLILGVTSDFNKLGISSTAVGAAAETVRSTISTVHDE